LIFFKAASVTGGGNAAGDRSVHSSVTEAELAATCGLLDSVHSQTWEILEKVLALIELRPSYWTITPDSEIWVKLECSLACWPLPRDTDKNSGGAFSRGPD